uniref:alpha/beta hydrolase family protein n=1 Tax=Alistipes sp. TaxID=1872444 RepID=UPI004056E21C
MKNLLRICLLIFLIGHALISPVKAQPRYEDHFTRPLSEVILALEERFGVEIEVRRLLTDTLQLAYADSRLRPYSLEESLEGICRPLDLKWSRRGERRYRIEPYEYYRRTPADGARLLEYLAQYTGDLSTWERRRLQLLNEARAMLNMQPLYDSLVKEPRIFTGEVRRMAGYTLQNYRLETLPGVYVGGTIYAPDRGEGPFALILSPAGHWAGGRLRADQQYRMATFARMGAVAVDLDIVGWGATAETVPFPHEDPRSMRLQALWSKAVADWVLSSRTDIDLERLAVTGGSGGATHTLLMALQDERFRVLAPVAHLVAHFDGGCPCESAVPITTVAGGSCTTELLAAVAAPSPLLVVSNGGDWTATYPLLEYPYLKRIWGLYGAASAVENCHLSEERHAYGEPQRRAVYAFFARVLALDLGAVDEGAVLLQEPEALELIP